MLPFFPSQGNNLASATATTMPRGKNCFDANAFALGAMFDNDGVVLLSSTPPPPRTAAQVDDFVTESLRRLRHLTGSATIILEGRRKAVDVEANDSVETIAMSTVEFFIFMENQSQ